MPNYPKGRRGNIARKCPKKRHYQGNQFTDASGESFGPSTSDDISASAKKLKFACTEDIQTNPLHAYRIIEFLTVFTALSDILICAVCKQRINFSESGHRGLGFKIVVTCRCGYREIHSGPLIHTGFEINRRLVLVMRLLGVARQGINTFCNLMDMCTGLSQGSYTKIIEHIHAAAKSSFDFLSQKAVEEEIEKNVEHGRAEKHLKVSGDGSWKKRGFTSLYGVTTLVGYYSGKVIDLVVKSSCCPACTGWKNKTHTEEYREWFEGHREECVKNHDDSARKMEVDSMKEMFSRSGKNFDVKYSNYIGDIDSKIFEAILELNPYGDELNVERCLGGCNQNANKSFNATVWRLAPKHLHSGLKIIEISAYIAAGVFNEGSTSILRIMNTLDIIVGTYSKVFAENIDEARVARQNRMSLSHNQTKAARTARKQQQMEDNQLFEEEEGSLYAPGIAD